MARKCRVNTQGVVHIGIDVVVVVIVVATKVRLHGLPSVDKKVIMGLVVATSIIIVDGFLRGEIVHHEVVMDPAPLHDHGGLTRPDAGQKGLSIPGVEGAVVATLSTAGEDQVPGDLITTSKAIVQVDPCPGSIEEDVGQDPRLRCLGLKEETALLLEQANLPGRTILHRGPYRMLPIRAIHACPGHVGQDDAGAARVPAGLVGVAPDRHGIAAQKGEVAVLDGGPTVVA
mmetsp:Transcript_17874/g.30240  ORF Transcript_17874/g.30240 Transcript_17874/m.30240 type:complete len:230 (+) Transcript_17874:337-1026(+)